MYNAIDRSAKDQTKARYNRIARFYDAIESGSAGMFKVWRKQLWSQAQGDVLEVGVGTGNNLPYYPRSARVTAVDLADRMLAHARQCAHELGIAVDLREVGARRNPGLARTRAGGQAGPPDSFARTRSH